VLESLPPADRETVWEQTPDAQAALAFVELSDPVRMTIAGSTPRERVINLLVTLDPGDLAAVSGSLAVEVLSVVSSRLASAERLVFADQVQFSEDSVGHYMTREWVAVFEAVTVERCLVDLRERGDLPPQTDRIFRRGCP
jgi:magnesium transporter